MGEDRLIRVSSDVDKGIEIFSPDFSLDMHFTENTYNVSQGIKHGVGPRFGISPIPGHNHTDDTETEPVGLMQAEGTGGADTQRLRSRAKFYGIIPFSYKKYVDLSGGGNQIGSRGDYRTHFLWLIAKDIGATTYVADLLTNGVLENTTINKYRSDIAKGLHPRAEEMTGVARDTSFHFVSQQFVDTLFEVDDVYYAKFAAMYVKTPKVTNNWLVGRYSGTPDATHTTDLDQINLSASTESPQRGGTPPVFITGEYDLKSTRNIQFYNLYNAGGSINQSVWTLAYSYLHREHIPVAGWITTADTYYNGYIEKGQITGWSVNAADLQTGRIDAATPAYADVELVLLHDPLLENSTSYSCFFSAMNKPLAWIFPDSHLSTKGLAERYVDLRFASEKMSNVATLEDGQNVLAYYNEDSSDQLSTCFRRWPNFVRGTAAPKDSASAYDGHTHVTLGEANSGVLRKNTTYEFTYSIYDKWFNYETNVGTPTKLQTGSDDYVAVSLFRDEKSGATWLQRCPGSNGNTAGNQNFYFNYRVIDFTYRANSEYPRPYMQSVLNAWEIRVYYREEGSYEWLPALRMDAAKYYYYPDHRVIWACQSPIASLPGGQPGGFNDYAPLPDDKYSDVIVFRDRVFWLSKQQIVWSYRKNPFSYAARNSVAVPTGEFRGMIAHAYPGQSEQNSRVIIFGSNETYIGRFTGNPELATVVVSPDTIGQFPIDGSDFNVDSWTSYTSFSGRSAVVANGILHYWGEKGVFADMGASLPDRISQAVEPDIHNLYDPNKIDEIFAHYFDKTKEIYWFYPPIRDNTVTDALIFNTQTRQFMLARFAMKIDSISDVNITNTDQDRDTNGLRAVASIRKDSSETIQRAYFLDILNRAGDMRPETEFLVKTIASPSSTTRTLTLAGGFDATNFAAIAAGDKVAIQQGSEYSGDSDVTDLVATVTAISSPDITISLPTGSGFKSALSPTTDKYFPIWIDRHNQFPYVIESNYWTPKGLAYWGFWQYIHMLFKINLLTATSAPELTLEYRTPIASEAVSNTLTLTDNSDGHYQILTQLKSINQSFEGQSLKWKISGNHFAHEWVLQYLGADIDPDHGLGSIQHFEG